jgi:hypothetical protein
MDCLGMDERILVKQTLKKRSKSVWTGVILPNVGTSARLF